MVELLAWINEGEGFLGVMGRLAAFNVVAFCMVVFVRGAIKNIVENVGREVERLTRRKNGPTL